MTSRFAAAIVLIPSLCACNAPRSRALEGAWRLLQVELVEPDGGGTVLPHQESLFLFTRDHYSMAYAFGSAPSPPYRERWRPSPEEKLSRFGVLIMNGGSYRVAGNRIIARPSVAVAPEFVHGEAGFRYRFVSDTLELLWDQSLAFDGLSYPSGGTATRFRLIRMP